MRGCHLRCLNNEKRCYECVHQNKDENRDYLYDVINVWPKGKDAGFKQEMPDEVKSV